MFLVLGNLLFVSFRQCITVIRFGFYDIQNNQGLGKKKQLRHNLIQTSQY